MKKILKEIAKERKRQHELWGEQNHPMTSNALDSRYKQDADMAKKICDFRTRQGIVTWYNILKEEFCEVFAESDPVRQRAELIQVAAVAVQIIEYLDRKGVSDGI